MGNLVMEKSLINNKPNIVALLGGSFNPIHYGHIKPALEAAKLLNIDTVRLLPNRISPLKKSSISTEHKLAMLQLVESQYPEFEIDPRELKQDKSNYTVHTLKEIRKEQPLGPLCFIMGYDSLLSLPHWHQWQELLNYVHLVVCRRPDQQTEPPQEIQSLLARVCATQIKGDHGNIILLNTKVQAVSSTEIRKKTKNSHSIKDLAPTAIAQYIEKNHLYLDGE